MNTILNALLGILIIFISYILAEAIIDLKTEVKPNQLICLKTDKIISRHNIILECWEATK